MSRILLDVCIDLLIYNCWQSKPLKLLPSCCNVYLATSLAWLGRLPRLYCTRYTRSSRLFCWKSSSIECRNNCLVVSPGLPDLDGCRPNPPTLYNNRSLGLSFLRPSNHVRVKQIVVCSYNFSHLVLNTYVH